MKKKILAVLLLVAIFAAFAGQAYAVTIATNNNFVEPDNPMVHVPEYIMVTKYRKCTPSDFPTELHISEGMYGYLYEGDIPLVSFETIKDKNGDFSHYVGKYEGVVYLKEK